jgi:hypothetical protein
MIAACVKTVFVAGVTLACLLSTVTRRWAHHQEHRPTWLDRRLKPMLD